MLMDSSSSNSVIVTTTNNNKHAIATALANATTVMSAISNPLFMFTVFLLVYT